MKVVPFLKGRLSTDCSGGKGRGGILVHDGVQRLDDVKVDGIVLVAKTSFAPWDRVGKRTYIVCTGSGGSRYESILLMSDGPGGRRTISCRTFGAIVRGRPRHLKSPRGVDELYQVVPEHWGGYFSEIFDEDVQEGADGCEGIQWVNLGGMRGM